MAISLDAFCIYVQKLVTLVRIGDLFQLCYILHLVLYVLLVIYEIVKGASDKKRERHRKSRSFLIQMMMLRVCGAVY